MIQPSAKSAQTISEHASAWEAFFRSHSPYLFQLALLLTADKDLAEISLVVSLRHPDLSQFPAQRHFLEMQELTVRLSCLLAKSVPAEDPAKSAQLVQAGLQPVLYLPASARLPFVLRCLLAYSFGSSAQILGISEDVFRRDLEAAVIGLNRICQNRS